MSIGVAEAEDSVFEASDFFNEAASLDFGFDEPTEDFALDAALEDALDGALDGFAIRPEAMRVWIFAN